MKPEEKQMKYQPKMPHVCEHVGEIEENKSKILQNKGKIIFPNM